MSSSNPVPLTDVSAKDRYDFILDTIRERIIRLQYPPGTRIGEEELAREFGVSRTPIRRVLNRLEYEEFVEIRHGAGTYITEIDWNDLTDAYTFRMSLAELIGHLSPHEPQPETVEAVCAIRERVRERGRDLTPNEYRDFNKAFHAELSKCIGNRQLRKTIDRLYLLTQRHWHAWLDHMDWDAEIDAFQWQLDDSIRCLEIGDTRGAGLVWRNVIASMIHRLQRALEGNPVKLPAAAAFDGHG